ncbi:hypothetical protein OIU85_015945 [Salix viminalis]|uniref:Protein N-terminal glutamine amidohydrolase n=1 Tax=Salix viminalis TaxID=40686 RepID=A0A9Q0V484_SALVM|nr:hypothetical protein OIU85_015945 [Salix viminalis]
MSTLEVSQFTHTPLYCEENVYFLLKKLCKDGVADADGSDLFVVFISNDMKQIPLWHQKASTRADGIILWDYHAICIQLHMSLKPSGHHFQLFSEYRRSFRIVHAPIFLRFFASDRRHMKDPDGNWTAQPPAYEPIVAEDGTVHNLNEYMEIHASDELKNMEADLINSVFTQQLGVAISENQLEEFFAQIS